VVRAFYTTERTCEHIFRLWYVGISLWDKTTAHGKLLML